MNGGNSGFGLGELLAVISSLCLAFALVLTSVYVKDIGAGPLATAQTVVTALMASVAAVIFEDFTKLSAASFEGVLALIYLAIGATFVVYLLQNTALTKLSPVIVSLLFCSQPVINVISSAVLLGERVSVAGAVGGIFITLGIILASLIGVKQ